LLTGACDLVVWADVVAFNATQSIDTINVVRSLFTVPPVKSVKGKGGRNASTIDRDMS